MPAFLLRGMLTPLKEERSPLEYHLAMQDLIAQSGDLRLNQHSQVSVHADPRQRAWVEVDPNAVEANTLTVKSLLAKGCFLMAVVKADGYGHGAETVARAALRGGAKSLGVATLQEGIELRHAGLECPILVLGNLTHAEDLLACLQWDLMPTLSSSREAWLCQNLAESCDKNFSVQVKVDTGMTRLGCDLKGAPRLINTIENLSYINLKGVYSHLALADYDSNPQGAQVTKQQQKRFDSLVNSLGSGRRGFCFHLANSAGTLRDSALHYDMVRVGLALYGCSPISNLSNDLTLRAALAVKARVTLIREVPSGVGVSYGHRFITKRPSRLAVVGIGYADGVNRALSGRISALLGARLLPQVGAITMDQMVLDATDHPDIQVGSVVTLLGSEGNKTITPEHWSDLTGSIPWEVLCGFKNRLPRLII